MDVKKQKKSPSYASLAGKSQEKKKFPWKSSGVAFQREGYHQGREFGNQKEHFMREGDVDGFVPVLPELKRETGVNLVPETPSNVDSIF